MADNLVSIMWNKIAALTGGSSEWPIGLGLRPWYLKVTISVYAAPARGMSLSKLSCGWVQPLLHASL